MSRVLVIGCGGVASVAIHKCCQLDDVFTELMIASRTKSKCDKLASELAGKTKTKITTAQVDADGNYIVEIPPGSSAMRIANILKEQGIITDVDAFMEKVEELGAESSMKYGNYKIPAGSTAEEIINKLM